MVSQNVTWQWDSVYEKKKKKKRKKKRKRESRVSSNRANIDANIPTVCNIKTTSKQKGSKNDYVAKKMQTIPRGVGIHTHVHCVACYWAKRGRAVKRLRF
jgi:hypothetical protein